MLTFEAIAKIQKNIAFCQMNCLQILNLSYVENIDPDFSFIKAKGKLIESIQFLDKVIVPVITSRYPFKMNLRLRNFRSQNVRR